MDMIQSNFISSRAINSNQQVLNNIKSDSNSKEQLKKVANEFESIFITKLISLMDKTVERENGIFGEESQYVDTFKNFVFDEVGRQLANNEHTSFGFAKQIYNQMEKYVN